MEYLSEPSEFEALEAYLAEDPAVLTESELEEIGSLFDIPLDEMKNIASGMSELRRLVREQYLEEDYVPFS